jgi:hypothetical protein
VEASRQATGEDDQALRWLRGIHWAWALVGRWLLIGLLLAAAAFALGMLSPASSLFLVLACVIGIPAALLLGVLVSGSVLLFGVWFLIVFFCYTRYSLKVMLTGALLTALGMRFLLDDEFGLRIMGGLVLACMAFALAVHVVIYHDPVLNGPKTCLSAEPD